MEIARRQLLGMGESRRRRNSSVSLLKLPSASGHVMRVNLVHLAPQRTAGTKNHLLFGATAQWCTFSIVFAPHSCEQRTENYFRRERRRDVVEIFHIQPSVVRVDFLPACISRNCVDSLPAIRSPSIVRHSFVCIPFSVIYFSFS